MTKQVLDATDQKAMNDIVCRLIVKNMQDLNLNIEDAKTAAFNRLFKDSPKILSAWLNRKR